MPWIKEAPRPCPHGFALIMALLQAAKHQVGDEWQCPYDCKKVFVVYLNDDGAKSLRPKS